MKANEPEIYCFEMPSAGFHEWTLLHNETVQNPTLIKAEKSIQLIYQCSRCLQTKKMSIEV